MGPALAPIPQTAGGQTPMYPDCVNGNGELKQPHRAALPLSPARVLGDSSEDKELTEEGETVRAPVI